MKKNIVIAILTALCIILSTVCAYLFTVNASAFDNGYNSAIKDAQLLPTADEDTYYIMFGDNVNEYSFD